MNSLLNNYSRLVDDWKGHRCTNINKCAYSFIRYTFHKLTNLCLSGCIKCFNGFIRCSRNKIIHNVICCLSNLFENIWRVSRSHWHPAVWVYIKNWVTI